MRPNGVSNGAASQTFADNWAYGNFHGVAADANTIYAAGWSYPGEGLTQDGVGGTEVKSIFVRFNADGTAGGHHARHVRFLSEHAVTDGREAFRTFGMPAPHVMTLTIGMGVKAGSAHDPIILKGRLQTKA